MMADGGCLLNGLVIVWSLWLPADRGWQLIDQHRWSEALVFYENRSDDLSLLRRMRAQLGLQQHLSPAYKDELDRLVNDGGEQAWRAEAKLLSGLFLLAVNRFDEAIVDLEEAIDLGLTETDAAWCRIGLARAWLEKERQDEAWLILERVATELVSYPEHLLVGWHRLVLGRYYFVRDQMDKAHAAFEEARLILERELGPDHPDMIEVNDRLVETETFLNDLETARPLAERNLSLRLRWLGKDHPNLALSYNSLGVLDFYRADYAAALEHWTKALHLLERHLPADDPEMALTLSNMATAHVSMGQYVRAKPIYERVLAIYEQALGSDHSYVGTTLSNLAGIERRLGDVEAAKVTLQRALQIKENTLGADHQMTQRTRYNLANAYLDLHDDVQAAALLKVIAASSKSAEVLLPTMSSLGAIALRARDWDAAIGHFSKSLAGYQESLPADHPYISNLHYNLGHAHFLQGDLEQAEQHFLTCLKIRREALGDHHPQLAEALVMLAQLRAAQDQWSESFALASQAELIGRDHLRLTIQSLSERESLQFADVRFTGFGHVIATAAKVQDPQMVKQAFAMTVETRALILDEMVARLRSQRLLDRGPLGAKYREVSSALAKASLALIDRNSAPIRQQVDQLRQKREDLERQLGVDATRQEPTVDQVMEKLPVGCSLLSYVVAGASGPVQSLEADHLYAFVVNDGQSAPHCLDLGAMKPLRILIDQYRREMIQTAVEARGEERLRVIGQALRSRIWDPVAGHLDEQVVIVPDDALHLLSFPSLPDGEASYLGLGTRRLRMLSAERNLVDGSADRRGSGLLALGAPDFGRDELGPQGSELMAMRTQDCMTDLVEFGALPATRQEVEELAQLWSKHQSGQVTVLLDEEASEQSLRTLVQGFRVVHIATHGFFLDGSCRLATRQTRGVGGLSGKHREKRPNRLALSGLALSGANRRHLARGDHDGILTAEELASLDLSAAELVVLSACDTGVGDFRTNEGVFGLKRALKLAGSQRVMLSHWAVDDEATGAYMKAFYSHWLAGHGVNDSCRQARLDVVASRRAGGLSTHPFYWAAFVPWE